MGLRAPVSVAQEHSEAPSGLLRFFAASRSLRGTPRPRSVGIVLDNCLDGAHVTAHRPRSREGAMAARVDGEDAVGRAVASDLMERCPRLTSGDASRPSDDPTSPRAWFETALRSIRDGRCHAYCAAPGMPSAVLWSAWEALGPPPPPDHLAVPDVESADPNDSAGEQWRALLESSTLASCARCVRAYRAQVDRWDSAAETAQTEEEHDAAVLAALLRERDDARHPEHKGRPLPSRRFRARRNSRPKRRLGRGRPLCSGCLAS